ncbi:MAG: YciI family protein [Chromatiaceae bacterium]|nr:YciI family protein [Chromatiaceae bacterium]
MKFICLGYLDESSWNALSIDAQQQFVDSCFAYDDELRRGRHYIGGEALGSASAAVTLSLSNGKVDIKDGPFQESKEVLGGFLLLEANDLNHAISLMSRHPGLKAGPFEIRAADETIGQMLADHARRIGGPATT